MSAKLRFSSLGVGRTTTCARWSRRRCAILAVFFAVALVACNDSTTEPTAPLTLEETEALYQGLSELARDTTAEVISMTSDGVVLACPLGGQVTALVDFREEMAADTARLISHTMLDPDGCVLSSEGYEFTLDGNPNVQIDLTLAIVESTFEFLVEGSMTGGVDWQLGDRSGSCMVDLTLAVDSDLSGAEPMVKATVSGTMCGLEVEFDQEVGVTGRGNNRTRRSVRDPLSAADAADDAKRLSRTEGGLDTVTNSGVFLRNLPTTGHYLGGSGALEHMGGRVPLCSHTSNRRWTNSSTNNLRGTGPAQW